MKVKSLMIMSLALVLSACNGTSESIKPSESGSTPGTSESTESHESGSQESEEDPGDENVIPTNARTLAYGLAGKKTRNQYNGLLSTSIGSLNYLKTQEANNAQHFANFIDGLLTHNEFGVLVKNLATKVTHNDDFSEFEFTVKRDVEWQQYDGTQYEATIDGKKVKQFVSPQDWVTTAQQICTYSNASDLKYLISTFVEGAEEYYWYTRVLIGIAQKEKGYNFPRTDYESFAEKLNELIRDNNETVWKLQYDSGEKAITADDVPNIANMSRFGVQADLENYTVTYRLIQKAPYFPTLFTYSCYLPTNQYFIKDKKFVSFGTEKDAILYNGPYLLNRWDEIKVVYVANEKYWNKENTITVDKINYQVIADVSTITDGYTRNEFEAGRIDGFSLNKKDGEGWTKYVTGPDAEAGYNYENPYSPLVNSRLLDTIGNMYGSNIVMDRVNNEKAKVSLSKSGTAASIANTSKALALQAVRTAILDSYDYNLLFDLRYETADEELRQQEKVWTYVPKGFVIDDNGDDYLTHYYDIYAEKKGLDGAGDIDDPVEGTAAYELRPGQTGSLTLTQDEVNDKIDDALAAIELYNSLQAKEADKITLPVQLELYSLWFDDDSKDQDSQFIDSLNERLNKQESNTPYFKVVPTDKVDNSNYESASRAGQFDITSVQWGWGADYGDPLTFMNTYTIGGDWADIFPFVGQKVTDNYVVEDGELIKNNLLEEYTELVNQGALETEDFNKRFDYFAEAEYMLINELGIYKPETNNGQGWSLSVSRSAGYFMPTASYGLSSDRLVGWYILDEVMTRSERQYARAAQQAEKEAYVGEHGSIYIYED